MAFTPCYTVTIANFEQVNARWHDIIYSKRFRLVDRNRFCFVININVYYDSVSYCIQM